MNICVYTCITPLNPEPPKIGQIALETPRTSHFTYIQLNYPASAGLNHKKYSQRGIRCVPGAISQEWRKNMPLFLNATNFSAQQCRFQV